MFEKSTIREEYKYQKIDKWLVADRAMFWKKSIYDYEADDDGDEAAHDEFIDDEPEVNELIRILE